MQSCHIVVAVRLKTRMTELQERARAARNRAASADGLTEGLYNQTGRAVCTLFHIWEHQCGPGYRSPRLRLLFDPGAAGMYPAHGLTFATPGYTVNIMYI
jgi:hypothetical protein